MELNLFYVKSSRYVAITDPTVILTNDSTDYEVFILWQCG